MTGESMGIPGVLRAAGTLRSWLASGPLARFALAPASAAPLAALRIGIAAVLLLQATLTAPALSLLGVRSGALRALPRDILIEPGLSCVAWFVDLTSQRGVDARAAVTTTGAIYVLSLVALLLGWRTRTAALAAWLAHLALMTIASTATYGADYMANVFLFYLVWMPSGAALSLDRRLGRTSSEPTVVARLGLRVVQLHLCTVYLTSGLGKASGASWWNGEAIWRALMLPEYRQLDFSWLARHAWLAAFLGWAVLAIEVGYAFLIWPRRTRLLWVIATAALHIGIAVFMGLLVFGALMTVPTIALFAVPCEPRSTTEKAPGPIAPVARRRLVLGRA
ncbi:HTTM domain-containing protein [Sorangium sp. So ce426]|uniref:HTTM domain-containing protein n=1 Tax=Sorangium sp. So ce426 TaxID=3133312 RepID=UPI003F5B72C0